MNTVSEIVQEYLSKVQPRTKCIALRYIALGTPFRFRDGIPGLWMRVTGDLLADVNEIRWITNLATGNTDTDNADSWVIPQL